MTVSVGSDDDATGVATPSAPPRRARILVIDDEPMLGQSIRRLLTPLHDVSVTASAREAIGEIGAGARFDVILCDLMMPEMSGMDLHAKLMEIVPQQAERIVFMTGDVFANRARVFLDQTASPRLEKPFDVSHLRALVRIFLRKVQPRS
jgi:two-component system, NtrC family, sensor kinase